MSRETLAILANPNFKGITTDSLIYILQDCQEKVGMADEDHEFFLKTYADNIIREIERRQNIDYRGILNTNKEMIAAIKTAVKIEDVLEWYTEVIYHQKKWSYRCTLHGEDNHPSGTIYPDQGECWCFACNKGGDVFDVLQLFGRMDFIQALNKLASHIGIEPRPHREPKYLNE